MISSASNPQIKMIVQLMNRPARRREQDMFVIEGEKLFLELPQNQLVKAYVSESFYHSTKGQELLGARGVEDVEILADSLFAHISDTKTPQGILCLARQSHYTREAVLGGDNPLLLLLEDIRDPGNLGTILRTGEGAGVTGVVLNRACVDLYNPKTIRATMGSIYRVPFLCMEDFGKMLEELRKRSIRTYAAHLGGRVDYDKEDYRGRTAFLIGNESHGISDGLAERTDALIRIPMAGQLESLNASVAAAVLMYEASRQRRG